MQHGVHGGHADDVFVALKTVKRARLQKFPLRRLEAVAHATLDRLAVGRGDFADKFR